MKYCIIIISSIIFISTSCIEQPKPNSESSVNTKETESSQTVFEHNHTTQVKQKKENDYQDYNRIIINFHTNYFSQNKQRINYAPFSNKIIYETLKKTDLNQFNEILKSGRKTGYCCCPDRVYMISLYDNTRNIKNYYLDNGEFDDKIRIFDGGYQYSYLIDKDVWIKFINNIDTISSNEYRIYDSELKTKLYNYCQTNNLVIKTSNTSSKYWTKFEGRFNCKYSSVGEYLEEDSVINKIKTAYPNDNYIIEKVSRYQMCDTNAWNDCYEEYILEVFCDKKFYDKFNVYEPKSYFNQGGVSILVLGPRSKLNKLDSFIEKENNKKSTNS